LDMALLLCMMLAVVTAHAQEATVEVNLPAQGLGESLKALGRQTPLQLFFTPDLVAGKSAPAVRGRMTPQQALDAILKGSGLDYRRTGDSVTLMPSAAIHPETLAPEVRVESTTERFWGDLPPPFPGGQVARGGQVGILGNVYLLKTPFSTT